MNEKELEFYQEYLAKYRDQVRARHYAKQKYNRWIVTNIRQNNPALYAKVQAIVQTEQASKQRELSLRRQREERLRNSTRSARHALVCTGLPLPDLRGESLVAFRTWEVGVDGQLHGVGAGSKYAWREVNFADAVPSQYNANGLYAIRIDPQGLLQNAPGYFASSRCSGLVSLSGTVIEHEDGVLRAECARILCIWYVMAREQAYVDVPTLYELYPTTTVYVCSPKQAAEALFVVAAAKLLRNT